MVASSWTVPEGKLEEFPALAIEMPESKQTQPGTLAYEWHFCEDGSPYGRYADRAAAMAHTGGEDWHARVPEPGTAILEIANAVWRGLLSVPQFAWDGGRLAHETTSGAVRLG